MKLTILAVFFLKVLREEGKEVAVDISSCSASGMEVVVMCVSFEFKEGKRNACGLAGSFAGANRGDARVKQHR